MAFGGFAFDLWENIDQDCQIGWEVTGDEIQLSLNVAEAWLNLTFTRAGLAALATEVSRASASLDAAHRPGCKPSVS